MKKILLIIFLLTIAKTGLCQNIDSAITKLSIKDSSSIEANISQADSIDIRQIVESQIAAVKEKQTESLNTEFYQRIKKNGNVGINKQAGLNNTLEDFYILNISPAVHNISNVFSSAEEITIKVSILAGALFLALLIVFTRRKLLKRDHKKNNLIKESIKILREERAVKKNDPKMKDIRNKLVNNPSFYDSSKAAVSKVARELNIAQGEVLLAAKIKSHELNKSWAGSNHKKESWKLF